MFRRDSAGLPRIADGEVPRHATVRSLDRSLDRSAEVRVIAQCRIVIFMGNHPVEYLRQRMQWSFDDSAGVLVLWIWCPSTGKFIELLAEGELAVASHPEPRFVEGLPFEFFTVDH